MTEIGERTPGQRAVEQDAPAPSDDGADAWYDDEYEDIEYEYGDDEYETATYGDAPDGAPARDLRPAALVARVRGWSLVKKQCAAAAILVLLCLGIGIRLTPNGLVIGGDSTTYLAVTNNIVEGKGITSPFVNEWDEMSPERSVRVLGSSPSPLWPPGYPVAIASATKLGLSVDQAARLVSILALMGVTLGAAWLAARLANGSPGAMLATGFVIGFSPSMQTMTSAAYSDLMAAALSTAAVVALVLTLEKRARLWPVALAAFWVLAAGASLTRVAAAGMVVAAAVLLVWRFPASRALRLVVAGVAMSSLVPLYLWRSHVAKELGGTATNITLHPRWDAVRETPNTFYHYLIPDTLQGAWQTVTLVILGVLALLIVVRGILRRRRAHLHARLVAPMPRRAIIAVIIGYVVATLAAAFFFGALLTVDARTYLSVLPLLVALVVGLATGLFARPTRNRETRQAPVRFAGIVPALLVVVVVLVEVTSGWNEWLLARPLVASSHVLGTVEDHAVADTAGRYPLLFSNSPSNLYVLTGQSAAPPPVLIFPSSGQPNPDHDAQLDEMGRIMRERNAAYVFFVAGDYFGTGVFLNSVEIVKRLDLIAVGPLVDHPNAIVFVPRPAAVPRPADPMALPTTTTTAPPPSSSPPTTGARTTTTTTRRAAGSR